MSQKVSERLQFGAMKTVLKRYLEPFKQRTIKILENQFLGLFDGRVINYRNVKNVNTTSIAARRAARTRGRAE